jgi:prolipoprotein diacylglyceryltransferase
MIPYIHISAGSVLQPFGLLVATGVIIGTILAVRRARRLGFDVDALNSFITWMLVMGFICGHVLDDIFYHPSEVAKKPWKLLMLWEGLSSFGGFTGAAIGIVMWRYLTLKTVFTIPHGIGRVVSAAAASAVVWLIIQNAPQFATLSDTMHYVIPGVAAVFGWTSVGPEGIPIYRFERRKEPAAIFAYADLILSVFPVAWVFGRSGCSSVHDHPGAIATKDALLSVAYPSGIAPGASPEVAAKWAKDHGDVVTQYLGGVVEFVHGTQPRYDLGLLELMFTIVLASLLALTWHKKVPTGSYIAATSLAYAPVRFAMDFLRITDGEIADPRYGGLTPAQWECVALFTWGLYVVFRVWGNEKRGFDPASLVMHPSLKKKPAPKKLEPAAAT